jgi:hypothetical protein
MLFIILLGFTDYFVPLIEHDNVDSFHRDENIDLDKWKKSIHNNSYYIRDVMDSPLAKLRLEEMDRNYESFVNSKPSFAKLSIKKVNILVGSFYDGVRLFSRVWTFWPLLMNIFNLPIALRGIYGVSHFLTTFFGHPGNETSSEGKHLLYCTPTYAV